MQTAFDFADNTLTEGDRRFLGRVREFGFSSTSVTGDSEGPAFTYSTGFWLTANHPEVIIMGLPSKLAHDLLWLIFNKAREGKSLPVGEEVDWILADLPAVAFPVSPQNQVDYLCWADWFYCRAPFPALQIVWTDKAGLFPWQPGFDAGFEQDQADLSEAGWPSIL